MKEAMSMRSSGHLLRRAGRKFVRNLIWWAVIFGSPAVILAAVTDLYLVGVAAFVGASVAVMAAIMTVGELWSGAPDEPHLGGHDYHGSPPDNAALPYLDAWGDGGGGDGGGGG
jgi:hypothetical protein